jgi:translin
VLDSIRRDDFSRCDELLDAMDDIYSILVTIDFPDAITRNLRRTTDSARGILEKTRSDVTVVIKQKELENKIKSIIGGIPPD